MGFFLLTLGSIHPIQPILTYLQNLYAKERALGIAAFYHPSSSLELSLP